MKADEESGLYTTRKQTAVDWIKDMLEWNYGDTKMLEITWENLDDLLERAKKIEKDQIELAHLNGQSEWDIKALQDINKKLAEEYYKETYTQK